MAIKRKIYITGTGSGIGNALAKHLLADESNIVTGISRKNEIKNDRFEFVELDLNIQQSVDAIQFDIGDCDEIVLVNNAGIVGPIKPLWEQTTEEIFDLNNVNISALTALCSTFTKYCISNNYNGKLINISSGAATSAIDAWSTYCASKAAVDLMSLTLASELNSRSISNVTVKSVAPGVVDTDMQHQIRSAGEDDFLVKQKFVDLKANGELVHPHYTAQKLSEVIANPNNFSDQTVISLRDYY